MGRCQNEQLGVPCDYPRCHCEIDEHDVPTVPDENESELPELFGRTNPSDAEEFLNGDDR